MRRSQRSQKRQARARAGPQSVRRRGRRGRLSLQSQQSGRGSGQMLVYSFKYVIHHGSTGSAPHTWGKHWTGGPERWRRTSQRRPSIWCSIYIGLVLSNIRGLTKGPEKPRRPRGKREREDAVLQSEAIAPVTVTLSGGGAEPMWGRCAVAERNDDCRRAADDEFAPRSPGRL